MPITFISQGFNPDGPNYAKAVDKVGDILSNPKITKFQAFVAFANEAGVQSVLPDIQGLTARGGFAHVFLGVDLQGTSKEALECLLSASIPASIVHSRNSVTYHPKIYTFEGPDYCAALVGSSNLTGGGLDQNIEASLFVEGEGDSYGEAKSVIDSICTQYADIINETADICSALTPEILQVLIDSKTVISEKESRRLHNKRNQELPTTPENRGKLNGTFGTSNTAKSRRTTTGQGGTRRRRKDVETGVLKNPDGNASIVREAVEFSSGAMWICTWEMTGGSRNILDLSMQGRREGITYPGSSSFFMDDPSNHAAEHDITIIYDGKRYEGNTIKYTEKNSNWRFQLKGETSEGDRLSSIGAPRAGWSGFQHVIFVFEKTAAPKTYTLSILDESELENLKDDSVQWTNGGRGGQGRPYGWLL